MPQPVTLPKLREHFKVAYQLEDDQVEVMLQSSSRSIIKVLAESEVFLDSIKLQISGGGSSCEELCRKFFHSLKGLFLNMGEGEWALYAKQLEAEYRTLSHEDLLKNIAKIRNGMAEIVGYSNEC